MSAVLPVRQLGDLTVPAMGLGCMGATAYYGPTDDAAARATVHAALDAGVTLFATADVFGPESNELWLARALGDKRKDVAIATAFGEFTGAGGRPEDIRRSCEASLRRLGFEAIALYFQFRIDPDVPVEESWGEMSRLVEEGKVQHLGLCEVRAETLRRANAVHPVTAVQSEYSLWTRDPETEGVIAAMRDIGAGLIASSPLGRGFLAGSARSPTDLDATDTRHKNPRFQPETLAQNLELARGLDRLAGQAGISSAELALAWLLAQGTDVVPIPGARSASHLRQNLRAIDADLAPDLLESLSALFTPGAASGDRYSNMAFTRG